MADTDKKPLGRPFHTFLQTELGRWVEQGLVTAAQKEAILAGYTAPEEKPRRRVSSVLPAILIALAVVLIGVGLILFYAANWRKMLPAVKLTQVVGMLVATYGGSYYQHFRRKIPLAGRGLLMLGMISFGAAIGLVAQIFHISAHPSNGVLLWLLGVLSLSIVMDERFGYYLAAILAMVWNVWEVSVYGSPNYPFVLFPALLFYLFQRRADAAGQLVAALECLFYFYQVNILLLPQPGDPAVAGLLLLHLPLGVVLIGLDRLVQRPAMRIPLAVLGALGWVFVFAPLIGLSWPIQLERTFPLLSWPLGLEHALALAIGTGFALRLRREGQPTSLFLGALGFGALSLVLPLGSKPVLLVAMHLGLLGLILGMLWFSHAPTGRAVDRVFAFLFAVGALVVKGSGLLTLGLASKTFAVAYGLGYVLFATVVFLINQLVRDVLKDRFRPGILDGMCALTTFLVIYALSFRVAGQSSILDADRIVLLLVGLLVGLALLLYAVLWRRGAPRLPLGLSALIFLVSTILLFAAGPSLGWQVYSVLFNLLLLLLEGALLYHATRVNSALLANAAIAAFAVQVFTRYVDVFWDLLSGSLLFIITGLVVFGGGFVLELNRRKLMRHIREQPPRDEEAA